MRTFAIALIACYASAQEVVAEPEPQPEMQSKLEQAAQKIRDAAISYGFEPEVVSAWMEETGSDW